MSDSWPFSLPSTSIMHHSSEYQSHPSYFYPSSPSYYGNTPQAKVTSPHIPPPPQVTSPHLPPPPQVTSSYLSPLPQVPCSPLYPQVTPTHLVPQHHFYTHSPDPGGADLSWVRSEQTPLFRCDSHLYDQSQTSAHLDLHLQVQDQDQDLGWGPVEPALSQPQSLRRWSSEGFFSTPQTFCTPSPHYPQALEDFQPHNLSPYNTTFDPEPLLLQNSEEDQDQTAPLNTTRNSGKCCFSPQETGATQKPEAPAEETCRGERGGAEHKHSKLLCMICKRDFRSLPALNGHMRSHSRSNKVEGWSPLVKPSVAMVTPVQSRQRRSSRPSSSTIVLYRSLMRLSNEEEGEEGMVAMGNSPAISVVARGDSVNSHYTPPPMLCPLRAGPGLYCGLSSRRQQRVQTVRLHNRLNELVAVETAPPPPGTLTPGIKKARINVGQGFQADIPPLQHRKPADYDSHDALLQWRPWADLEQPDNQYRVEALLMMARCSVVPGGRASPESALLLLSESRGDFLLTVEKLLTPSEASGDVWSAAERQLLVKSLQLHHKNFSKIQQVVQTKSISQCVEFYYLWKKKLSLGRSHTQSRSKVNQVT